MVTSYRNWCLKNLRPIDVKPPKSGWRILHKARSLMTSPHWWEANIWKAEVIWGNPPVGWKRFWKPGILGFIRQSSPVLVWIRVVSRKDIDRAKKTHVLHVYTLRLTFLPAPSAGDTPNVCVYIYMYICIAYQLTNQWYISLYMHTQDDANVQMIWTNLPFRTSLVGLHQSHENGLPSQMVRDLSRLITTNLGAAFP